MKKKGFTLMELLVVIAVIGMLSTIVLVSMSGIREKARDTRRMSDLRQISTAMELAYSDSATECGGEGAYPTRGTYQTIYNISDGTNGLPRICPTTGQYLNPTPNDPVANQSYKWMGNNATCTAVTPYIQRGQWYCIYANLEAEQAFIVASQRGVKKISTSTPPTNCLCGF